LHQKHAEHVAPDEEQLEAVEGLELDAFFKVVERPRAAKTVETTMAPTAAIKRGWPGARCQKKPFAIRDAKTEKKSRSESTSQTAIMI